MPDSIAQEELTDYPLLEKSIRASQEESEKLTDREREVMQLIAEGYTRTQTAAKLSISPRTVEMHRSNIMRKLGLRNQTDLIRYALRLGYLPLDDHLEC